MIGQVNPLSRNAGIKNAAKLPNAFIGLSSNKLYPTPTMHITMLNSAVTPNTKANDPSNVASIIRSESHIATRAVGVLIMTYAATFPINNTNGFTLPFGFTSDVSSAINTGTSWMAMPIIPSITKFA